MKKILIKIKNKANAGKLYDYLSTDYPVEIVEHDKLNLKLDFDICVIDHVSFNINKEIILKMRRKDLPLHLPFLLLESRNVPYESILKLSYVDDVIRLPVKMGELRSRVSNLLNTRQLTRQLKAANTELFNKNKKLDQIYQMFTEAVNYKNNFIYHAASDLKGPLESLLEETNPDNNNLKDFDEESFIEYNNSIYQKCLKMVKLLDDLFLINEMSNKKLSPDSLLSQINNQD